MYSIFNNDFYEREALPNWSWEISILSNPLEEWTEEQMSIFSNAATKIEIPESRMETTISQFRGLSFDIPTRFKNNDELTITFNENEDMELYKALREMLYYTTFNDGYIIDNWSHTDDDGNYSDTYMLYYAPFDIMVRMLDPKDSKKVVYNYIFKNCFISNVSEVEFSQDAEEVVEYSVRIAFNFRIEGLDADEYLKGVEHDANSEAADLNAADPINEDATTDGIDGSQATPSDDNTNSTQEPMTDGVDGAQTTPTEQPTQASEVDTKAEGVDNEETPQERAAREAAESMNGYHPSPSSGESDDHADDNRSYSPGHDVEDSSDKPSGADSSTDGISGEKTESPQEKAAREAAESMNGYHPAPTTDGVDDNSNNNRSYSPGHDTPVEENTPVETPKEAPKNNDTEMTPPEPSLPECTDESDFVLKDVDVKPGTDDKWNSELNDSDMSNFASQPGEIPPDHQAELDDLAKLDLDDDENQARADEVTKGWREDVNQQDLDDIGNEELLPPPSDSDIATNQWREDTNEADLRAMGQSQNTTEPPTNDIDAPIDTSFKNKDARDMTAKDWDNEKTYVDKKAEEMKQQQETDDSNNVVRLSRSNGLSNEERQAVEAKYKAQGKTVVWY